VIEDGVTSIGKYAFDACLKMADICIADSVTSIGAYAFRDCTKLTSVVVPDSITSIGDGAFYSCDILTNVYIGVGVTSIGRYMFYNCSTLTSITIGNSVTSIDTSAFEGCSSLTSITIPDGVTSIGRSAFENCSSLTEIDLPVGITVINERTFAYCSNLTRISIPNSVTYICGDDDIPYFSDWNRSPFVGCNKLKDVYITDIKTWCGIYFEGPYSNPLYYASNLFLNGELVTNLIIPDEVKNISSYAFAFCDSLASMTMPDSVISIGNHAFYSCKNIIDIRLSESLASIGEGTFTYCSNLTNIVIPDSVATIGFSYISFFDDVNDGAFEGCTGLTSVTIGDGVISIGYDSFANCSSLTTVTIGEGVTSIDSAFDGCDSLWHVLYKGTAEDWNNINTRWNDNLTSVTRHYECTGEEEIDPITKYCSICASACDHSYEAVITDPTCTEGGYTTHTCSLCADSYVDSETAALGHDYKGVYTPPTYTKEGFTTFTCSRCGDSYVDNYVEKLDLVIGDVDGDGDADSADAMWILRYDAWEIDRFPIQEMIGDSLDMALNLRDALDLHSQTCGTPASQQSGAGLSNYVCSICANGNALGSLSAPAMKPAQLQQAVTPAQSQGVSMLTVILIAGMTMLCGAAMASGVWLMVLKKKN